MTDPDPVRLPQRQEAEKVVSNLQGDPWQVAGYVIQRCGDFVYDHERQAFIAECLRAMQIESAAASRVPEGRDEVKESLRQLLDGIRSLERALRYAYSGSAEHGSFLTGGRSEYTPSVFMTLDQAYDNFRELQKLLAPAFLEGKP